MTSISNVNAGPPIYPGSLPQAPAEPPAYAPPPPAAPSFTPTQAVVAEANRVAYVTDKLGRRIGITRVSASLRRKVLRVMNGEDGDKPQLFIMALAAACVVEIDGVRVPFPTSEAALDALIDRLEQEGLAAVTQGWADHFPLPRDDLKNS